jgi:high-affinity nickel-transport protein
MDTGPSDSGENERPPATTSFASTGRLPEAVPDGRASILTEPKRDLRRLSRKGWAAVLGMAACIALLHLVGWGTLVAVVAPGGYQITDSQVFGIGLGLTAYTLGLRHAFDADHIAAIDNTTRKLMGEGQRPVSVGFWFSLGHSTVVFVLCALLAFGVHALAGQVENDTSALQRTTGLVGVTVSGVFLLLIGLLNLIVLRQIVGVFRKMKSGSYDEAQLEHHLNNRGIINRLLKPAAHLVRKPRHMYTVGLLFGLGFDTATEVSLLVLAGGAAAFSLPWYAILTLPVLFTAGMSLLDTADGCIMTLTYGWAFSTPVRKLYYNITITGLSVAVALIIGAQEILSILADKLNITNGPIGWISQLNLNDVGFVIVGLFILAWLLAVAIWHLGRIEARWTHAE